jgi:serine/threonine-protein kinase
MFSVSAVDSGALAYRGGAGAKLFPTWFDATGHPGDAFDVTDAVSPAISPDGTRIAVAVGPGVSRDIWTIDVARKTSTRLTFDPASDDNPVWSPDSKSIAFSSDRGGVTKMYVKPADGSADERLLTDQPGVPTSWSKDGRFLLFTSTSPRTGLDIWALPNPGQPARESKPYAVLATPFNEQDAHFSPDGRWIAYGSNESSVGAVYVRPFTAAAGTNTGAKWLVSNSILSFYPRWSGSGSQLYFAKTSTFDIQAVDVDTTKGFQAGTPRRVMSAPPPLGNIGWAVAPDDKRFLFITTPSGGKTAPFTVVLNWAAGLKK